jgi:hypothetical protein
MLLRELHLTLEFLSRIAFSDISCKKILLCCSIFVMKDSLLLSLGGSCDRKCIVMCGIWKLYNKQPLHLHLNFYFQRMCQSKKKITCESESDHFSPVLSVWCSSCFVQAVISLLQNAVSWMPYFCIFTVLAYVFCYGFGLGPIPYFIGSGWLVGWLVKVRAVHRFYIKLFANVLCLCVNRIISSGSSSNRHGLW